MRKKGSELKIQGWSGRYWKCLGLFCAHQAGTTACLYGMKTITMELQTLNVAVFGKFELPVAAYVRLNLWAYFAWLNNDILNFYCSTKMACVRSTICCFYGRGPSEAINTQCNLLGRPEPIAEQHPHSILQVNLAYGMWVTSSKEALSTVYGRVSIKSIGYFFTLDEDCCRCQRAQKVSFAFSLFCP